MRKHLECYVIQVALTCKHAVTARVMQSITHHSASVCVRIHLEGKYHVLPYVVEDVFFRTSLAAQRCLTNTVVQVAERDSWPSILEILINTANSLVLFRHL